jgi:hypothetical protein
MRSLIKNLKHGSAKPKTYAEIKATFEELELDGLVPLTWGSNQRCSTRASMPAPCLNAWVFLAIFVDDILVVIAQVKREFQSTFSMTDEGLAQEFLGVCITQSPGKLILDQENYCRSITRDFKKYIGPRNYSIVPMQQDVALDQPGALNSDQAAWVQRFPSHPRKNSAPQRNHTA